jgi:isopentenyldiphosphate isomerase
MEEWLYHVTEDDVAIGPVGRDEAHRSGALHRSGIVFLRRTDGRILLQHRSPGKRTFPDRFDASAAFHVTFGESYLQAARRELREETGVSAPVELVGTFVHHDPPEHQIVAVFVGTSDSPIRVDPNESVGFEWVAKPDLDRIVHDGNITPWLRDGWPVARTHV